MPKVVRTNDEGSAGARVCLLSAAIFQSLARAGQFSSDIQLQLARASTMNLPLRQIFFSSYLYLSYGACIIFSSYMASDNSNSN